MTKTLKEKFSDKLVNAFLNKKQVLYTKLLKMLHELCIEYIYYYRTINKKNMLLLLLLQSFINLRIIVVQKIFFRNNKF